MKLISLADAQLVQGGILENELFVYTLTCVGATLIGYGLTTSVAGNMYSSNRTLAEQDYL